MGQRCQGPARLATYKSPPPAAVCSWPLVPAAVPVLPLPAAVAGGTGPAAVSAGCLLAFGIVRRAVPPDLSTRAKPSGVLGLGRGWDWARLGNGEAAPAAQRLPAGGMLG